MGVARFSISPEFLREWIPLPSTTRILGSAESHGTIVVVVDDPALPELKEGEALTEVTPQFKRNPDQTVEFVDWGLA